MSKSSGGIGIGGLIFWALIAYSFFGGDDKEDKKVMDVEVNTDVKISDELKEKADKALEKAKEVIDVAKKKLDEAKKEKPKEKIEITPEEKVEPEPEVIQEPEKEKGFKPI